MSVVRPHVNVNARACWFVHTNRLQIFRLVNICAGCAETPTVHHYTRALLCPVYNHEKAHSVKVKYPDRSKTLLTLNSPPLPSSSSKTYPSTYEVGGGCHATVTLLFSALHSSGIMAGEFGAEAKQ